MTNTEFAAGLRELAAYLEAHPDAPQPYEGMHQHFWDKDAFLFAVREWSKGGTVRKFIHDGYGLDSSEYRVERSFGPIKVFLSIDRKKLCRLVSPAVYDCPDSLLAEESAEFTEALA